MLLRVRSETTGYVHALCLQFNSRSRCTLEDCDVACWSVCDDFILKDASFQRGGVVGQRRQQSQNRVKLREHSRAAHTSSLADGVA